MNQIMQINGMEVPIIEFGGIRVVTMKQIADLHGVNYNSIVANFNNNRKHFIEGTDFYEFEKLSEKFSSTFKIYKGTKIFFTETGYLMLVKSLTDDLAWKVQRILVNNYFKQSVVNDLWIILPRVARWCSRLVKRPWTDSQIIYYVMANYKLLEHEIKMAKRKGIGNVPAKELEVDNG